MNSNAVLIIVLIISLIVMGYIKIHQEPTKQPASNPTTTSQQPNNQYIIK